MLSLNHYKSELEMRTLVKLIVVFSLQVTVCELQFLGAVLSHRTLGMKLSLKSPVMVSPL